MLKAQKREIELELEAQVRGKKLELEACLQEEKRKADVLLDAKDMTLREEIRKREQAQDQLRK